MQLQAVPAGGVEIKALGLDKDLATEIQIKLRDLGMLDPPVDGDFGPVSKLALRTFAGLVNLEAAETISQPLAQALLNSGADTLLPIQLGTDFASRIIKYMQLKNYWVARAPRFLNIVYVEGANEDGTLNDDAPNKFNDRRLVIEIKNGKPTFRANFEATTEPGDFFTLHPENPKGAARIAFDQFKAWRVGTHKAGTPSAHEALVQIDNIRVHRDFNQDRSRKGDAIDVGSGFGVNQHKGFNMPPNNIGKASAGCLVGRTNVGHQEFMTLVKTDPRFLANNGYKYMTTIIAGDDLNNTVGG